MSVDNFSFRPYFSEDLEEVVTIFRTNIPKYFVPKEEHELREYLAEHPEDYYVLESGGETIAAGGVALNLDDTVSLCWGMVHNDLIGMGLGKRLTLYHMKKAREKWGDRPFIISTSQHTEGFYKKLGFETVERIPDGFGPDIDTCKMRCEPTAVQARIQTGAPV